jgi:alanyl-tRNA synthetase
MKTTIAYYEYTAKDPYKTNIQEIRDQGNSRGVILEKTIFYPEGGGQPADRGWINGVPLAEVQEQGGEILHLLYPGDGSGLAPGPAELRLDTDWRRDFTVHHTAQHLLSGTILRMTGFYTVSMHLGEDVCTIDVDTPELPADILTAVEEKTADAIEEDAPVIIHLCPPEHIEDFPLRKRPPQGEEVIRVVEIQGHDYSPCCGTHLQSTGYIGILRILGAEKYKGMTRITFIAGRRCLRDSRLLRQNVELISRALKVPAAETGQGVLTLLEKTSRLEGAVKIFQEDAARRKAETLLRTAGLWEADSAAGQGKVLIESLADADMDEVLRIGRAAQKLTGAVLVLGSEKEAKFAAFCSAKGADVRPLVKQAMEARNGRGGGGPSFFQGLFDHPETLKQFLSALRETTTA